MLFRSSIKMFFDNGGGQCYIIAVGIYQNTPVIDLRGDSSTNSATMYGLQDGLEVLALEDEPTLIVIPESVKLSRAEYTTLVQAVLLQCNTLRDRFAIFDIFDGKGDTTSATPKHLSNAQLNTNREYFGNNYLKYGAAYYPFLKTTMNFYVNEGETNVMVISPPLGSGAAATATLTSGVVTNITISDGGSGYTSAPTVTIANAPAGGTRATATATIASGIVTGIDITNGGAGYTSAPTVTIANAPAGGTQATATATIASGVVTGINITNGGTGYTSAPAISLTPATPTAANLASFKISDTALYNFVKSTLKDHFVVLPPSGAVVGVYAATDSNRGVWKAPANVSLANVIEPVIKLDNTKQDDLNVDATTGKSINAIRGFMGKGTLVWGARTLAGNDNEWRYIPVRRFFSVVEESVKKSTYWAVFEPNDANTWVKVRGMIENYLTQKWREGALAGATPKDAFFVKCGLGITMTAQDILEGRMNVEIGMAVVRPAEFIILKFSHKLQTS